MNKLENGWGRFLTSDLGVHMHAHTYTQAHIRAYANTKTKTIKKTGHLNRNRSSRTKYQVKLLGRSHSHDSKVKQLSWYRNLSFNMLLFPKKRLEAYTRPARSCGSIFQRSLPNVYDLPLPSSYQEEGTLSQVLIFIGKIPNTVYFYYPFFILGLLPDFSAPLHPCHSSRLRATRVWVGLYWL